MLGPNGVQIYPIVGTTTARPTNQISKTPVIMTDHVPAATIASNCSITSAAAQARPGAMHRELGAVGAGIGVPFAIALFAAVIIVRRERGRNKTLIKERQVLKTEVEEHRRNAEQLGHRDAMRNSAAFEVSKARYPAGVGTREPTELDTRELTELGTCLPMELGSVHAGY